jgi:hypothetical protein
MISAAKLPRALPKNDFGELDSEEAALILREAI